MTIIIILLVLWSFILLIRGEIDRRKYDKQEAQKMRESVRRKPRDWWDS
jgi:hypothetical protein